MGTSYAGIYGRLPLAGRTDSLIVSAMTQPAPLSQTVDVETPELVVLSYTIAGVGSRVYAAVIDVMVCVGLFLTTLFAIAAMLFRPFAQRWNLRLRKFPLDQVLEIEFLRAE